MRDDHWKSILFFRLNVNEMNIETVNIGYEIRIRIQSCLTLAPVVIIQPVLGESLNRRESHALGVVFDRFFFRPSRRLDATFEFGKVRIRKTHFERSNICVLTARWLSGLSCS